MKLQIAVYGTIAGLVLFGILAMEVGSIMRERTIALSILDNLEVCK
jgi:hypothetical protein